jgi:hypothetical protein
MPPATNIGVGTMDIELPDEGDFAYVKPPGGSVREGKVVSTGENYEIRLRHTEETITVPETEVWTTYNSRHKTHID